MNPSTQPISIHRSLVGLALIGLAGLAGLALVFALLFYFQFQPWVDHIVYQLLAGLTFVILMVTLIQAATYALASITIAGDHIEVANWQTIFSSRVAQADYADIEDVTVTQGSILARIFGYGTLLIQTAGTQTNFEITNIPNVYAWRDEIAGRAKVSQPV